MHKHILGGLLPVRDACPRTRHGVAKLLYRRRRTVVHGEGSPPEIDADDIIIELY